MNAAHWHLVLNHIPVVGSAFALLLLVWGMARRSQELKRAGLVAVAFVGLLTIPAYMTGEPAFESAMEHLEATPADEDPLVDAHKKSAGFAFAAIALSAVLAGVTLFRSREGRPVPMPLAAATLVLLALTVAIMGRTAQLGGTIRHPEIVNEHVSEK